VAKIASDMEKPNGITEVPTGTEAEFLAPLPVKKISGIGSKTAEVMYDIGIEKVGQLAEASEEYIAENVGDFAVGFKYIAMGLDDSPVKPYEGLESISRERTFMEDTDEEEVLMASFRHMARLVHRNALREQVRFRTVGIKVRFSDFSTFTREKSMAAAVDRFAPIMSTVKQLWQEFSPPQKKIRLLGVRLSGLESGGYVQTTLERWMGEL
jgi:nucleotidyltransferase/DNA polymerase involved in DNA repair